MTGVLGIFEASYTGSGNFLILGQLLERVKLFAYRFQPYRSVVKKE